MIQSRAVWYAAPAPALLEGGSASGGQRFRGPHLCGSSADTWRPRRWVPRGWWHLGTTVLAEDVGAPCSSPTPLPVVSSFPPAQGQVLRDELTTRGAARFSELRSHSSKLTKPEVGSGEPPGHSQRSAAQVAVRTHRWHLQWGQPCGSGAVSGYSVRVELNCRTVCCLESCLFGVGIPHP